MSKYLVCLMCMEYVEVGVDYEFRFKSDSHLDAIEAFLFRAHAGPGHSLACVDSALLQKIDDQAIRDHTSGVIH